jgi:hypothetical protein
MIFFTQKTLINIIKEMRPKYLYNKTIFVQMEIKDFYSYKNFGKQFNESFYIDKENDTENFEKLNGKKYVEYK